MPASEQGGITRRAAVVMFLVFAAGYFLSSLLRAVIATLAPTLTTEFALNAGQLGLLAGGYFLGFAVFQIPLGVWLDRYGPRRVLAGFLVLAVLSSVAFAVAEGFAALLVARVLGGVGVCGCLMAALTAYRRWLPAELQQRANSWMLMTGAFGLLAATLPVQWLLPLYGWRIVFVLMGVAFLLVIAAVWLRVPEVPRGAAGGPTPVPEPAGTGLWAAYRPVLTSRYFLRMAPVGLINYGALTAIQTLWAGPWMTQVTGNTPLEAASGLFAINLTMLVVFWGWGAINPQLARRGVATDRLLMAGLPLGPLLLLGIAWLGGAAGWAHWCVFFALSSFLSLMLPAIGMAFPMQIAGRALSAFNLTLFLGTFIWQWMIGLGIDALLDAGVARADALRLMMALVAVCELLAYGWFALRRDARGLAVT